MHEVYDTAMNYRDCSGKRGIHAVVKWLEGAKHVEPHYNRVRRSGPLDRLPVDLDLAVVGEALDRAPRPHPRQCECIWLHGHW